MLFLVFLSLFFSNPQLPPLQYDCNLTTLPGHSSRTMLCFHGYGGNFKVAHRIKEQGGLEETLISFNFPDHDIQQNPFYNPKASCFGTYQELLPVFHALKKIVIEEGVDQIDIYGFSAGGGVAINTIAALNSDADIGLSPSEKKKILAAIEKGIVLLDTPLKSLDELLAYHGSYPELEITASRFRKNNMIPLETIKHLKGLHLKVIVYFEVPDKILSNRDDNVYIERLKTFNEGKTTVLFGSNGGHNAPHPLLWNYYKNLKNDN